MYLDLTWVFFIKRGVQWSRVVWVMVIGVISSRVELSENNLNQLELLQVQE